MRLLSTTALTFGEFFNAQVPPYCILSHRWGDDEVTYDDVLSKRFNTAGNGYRKTVGACRLAKQRGFDWIWIDTCCINKDSSSELTEAINSMFSFYSQAELCIAYLVDVPTLASLRGYPLVQLDFLRKSNWFSRGWTLQELLAPPNLEFFDCAFQFIGSKAQLSYEVSESSGIAEKYLNGRRQWNYASVATRMSWASRRTTTRLEDQAYSLLGIFGVNMPLLYGEGKMAFFRLQREILSVSDDESIFAWIRKDATDDELFGMLAESPQDFRHSQYVRRIELPPDQRPPVSLTSRGVEFWHGFKKPASTNGERKSPDGKTYERKTYERKTYIKEEGLVTLACKRRPVYDKGEEWRTLAVYLREIQGAWYRVKVNKFRYSDKPIESGYFQTFYVAQPNLTTTPRFSGNRRDFGAFIRHQKEEEERADAEQRKKTLKYAGVAALIVGTGAMLKRH